MSGYLPAGWPPEVDPPGEPGWERSASAYLFDCCPPDFRSYQVLRRHPTVLAKFAVRFVAGQCATTQAGLAEIRTGLPRTLAPQVIEAAIDAWLTEAARLTRVQRSVDLISDALLGRHFVRPL